MTVPESFETAPEKLGGLGMSWLISSRSKRHPEVEIALFYRGTPNSAESVEKYRRFLGSGAALIFDHKSKTDEEARTNVAEIGAALGNAKNNQITNKNSGANGPQFFLEQLEFVELNKRTIMLVTGYFHGPEGEVQNHYSGVYIDASPDDTSRCRIEEITFQTSEFSLFKKYSPDFRQSLSTIRWSEKPAPNPPSTKDLFKLQF